MGNAKLVGARRTVFLGGAIAAVVGTACTLLLPDEPLTCSSDAECVKFPGTFCDLSVRECRTGTSTTDGGGDSSTGDSGTDGQVLPDGSDPCTAPNKPVVELKGEIAANQSLTCDKDYVLVGRVSVLGPAVLTIAPNTTIYGDPRVDATTNSVGRLLITNGAKINAVGTADKPIIFTSARKLGGVYAADGGTPGSGDWGGVYLLGEAPVNTATGTSDKPSLAPHGAFGGGKPNSDSGRIEYVRIEYGGALLPDGQDGTSIELDGVGDATVIDHLMVRFSGNDCVGIFGGRVNLKHILCQYHTDDGIAWENGWTGKVQFLIVQARPGVDDNASGLQGRSGAPPASPVSEPFIYNATFCGQNKVPGTALQFGLRAENFTKFHVFNSIFMGYQAAVDLRGTSYQADTQPDGGVIGAELKSSIAFGNTVANVAFDEVENTGGTSNPRFDDDNGFDEVAWWNTAGFNNSEGTPAIPKCFDPISPRFGAPAPINAATAAQPPNDGFYDPSAKYVGALRDQGDTWASGKWVLWSDK
ncbi:MAG: hypothetical protein JST00_13350 [Deltaproteobacteria bacterium]|nr:hypothetical protein [Deltaproteobacteria bacterium]